MGFLHVAFDGREERAVHGEEDRMLVKELANRAALAIENARLHEKAHRALAARDDMLAFVTHDLRNLLGTVLFRAEMLVRAGDQPERRSGRREVDAIRSTAVRMTALLDSLRDAGMMEAGQFTVACRPGEIAPVVDDAFATLRARAEHKNLRLDLRQREDLPPVSLDRERIHQVLVNIVGNAVEHTPDGGRITVDAEPWEDGTVRVAVADTGPGISPDDLEHLFERYWRRDTAARKGTGLGLYIAKGIVEAHGGRLWAESERGRGTTFFFTLRAAPASSTSTGGREPPRRLRSGRVRAVTIGDGDADEQKSAS